MKRSTPLTRNIGAKVKYYRKLRGLSQKQLAAQLQSEIARHQDALTPAIILIPGKEGSLGIGMANVTNAVERAVGADIL